MLAAWHPLTKAFLFLWFIRPVLLSLSGSIDIILIVLQLESDHLKVNSLMKVGIDPRKFQAHEKIWTYCMRKNQNFFFFGYTKIRIMLYKLHQVLGMQNMWSLWKFQLSIFFFFFRLWGINFISSEWRGNILYSKQNQTKLLLFSKHHLNPFLNEFAIYISPLAYMKIFKVSLFKCDHTYFYQVYLHVKEK